MVIIWLTELGKKIDLNTDHFHEELEIIKKQQTKIDNSLSEIKSILGTMNSILNDTDECISDREDRIIMEIIQSEQQTNK